MRKGFTLLEVLVAIIVFVLAVATILPLFAVGVDAHQRGMNQTEAGFLASRIAATLQRNLYDPNPKNLVDAIFEEGGKNYTYDAQFYPFDLQDPMHSAFVVQIQVKWGGELVESFETVLLRKTRR